LIVPGLQAGGVGRSPLLAQEGVALPKRPLVVTLVADGCRRQLHCEIIEVVAPIRRGSFDEGKVVGKEHHGAHQDCDVAIALGPLAVDKHSSSFSSRQLDLHQ
jgi:hypothetical protein